MGKSCYGTLINTEISEKMCKGEILYLFVRGVIFPAIFNIIRKTISHWRKCKYLWSRGSSSIAWPASYSFSIFTMSIYFCAISNSRQQFFYYSNRLHFMPTDVFGQWRLLSDKERSRPLSSVEEFLRIHVAGRSLDIILESWNIGGSQDQEKKVYWCLTRECRHESPLGKSRYFKPLWAFGENVHSH